MDAPIHSFPLPARRRVAVALVVVAAVALALASTTSAGVLESQLAQTKHQQQQVKRDLARNDRAQSRLLTQIERTNSRIADVNVPIGQLENDIAALEAQIQHRRERIAELREEYRKQEQQIANLALELSTAQDILAMRLVAAYKQGDTPPGVWLIGAQSLTEAFDRRDEVDQVLGLDNEIVERIAETERTIRLKRARNHVIQRDIQHDIASIDADLREADAKRDELVARRSELESLKAQRAGYLHDLQKKAQHMEEEYDQLQENAEALREAIASGASIYQATIPGGGAPGMLSWPVSGPVVSPFGWRWGRMHEGIDIAVPGGTPIHAAAAGVVTYCGWMSGYGNMVLVQHGGALSTGYAHQSQIAVSCGQFVTTGQVIGYVGCTGHCFGDHVHFETRINGAPHDPMGYL